MPYDFIFFSVYDSCAFMFMGAVLRSIYNGKKQTFKGKVYPIGNFHIFTSNDRF